MDRKVMDRNISAANAALVAKRIRQVGVDLILYGSDSRAGGPPARAAGTVSFKLSSGRPP